MNKTKSKFTYLNILLIGCYIIVSVFFAYNLFQFPKQYTESEMNRVEDVERELKEILDNDYQNIETRLDTMVVNYAMDIMIVQGDVTVYSSVPFDNPLYFTGSTNESAILLETQGFYNVQDVQHEIMLKVYHAPNAAEFKPFLTNQTYALIIYFLLLTLILLIMLKYVLKPLETVRASIRSIDEYDFDSVEKGSDELTQGISDFSKKLKGSMDAVARQHTELERELQIKSDRLDNTIAVSRAYVHDLKTPVHQLLLENEDYIENLEHPNKETLMLAHINAKRADTIMKRVNDILKMMNKNIYEVDQETRIVDVVSVLTNSINYFMKDFERRKLTVELEVDEATYAEVNVVYLKLLVHNLISNMVQYALEATTIIIVVDEISDAVSISCTNKGTLHDIERMAKSEYILNALSDEGNKENKYSSGNGLFLIRDLAQLMRGTFTPIYSEDSVTVTVTFPIGDLGNA